MPDPNGTDIANQYVGYKGIQPQQEGETNAGFRSRVAEVLRSNRMIVDAHEVINNRFHDEDLKEKDGGPVRQGLAGAAALAMAGHGEMDSVAIDDAAYGVMKEQERKYDPEYTDFLMLLATGLGGR